MSQNNIPGEIASVSDGIVKRFGAEKIYLFSDKRTHGGDVTAFKLCVILDCESRVRAERDIYLEIDSEVPFDVVVYSPGQFSRMCEKKGSFARKVMEKGVLLHG